MYYGTIIIVPQPVSSIMATVTNTGVYNIVVEWEVSINILQQGHIESRRDERACNSNAMCCASKIQAASGPPRGLQQRETLYGISGFPLDFHVVYGIYGEITENNTGISTQLYGISIRCRPPPIIDTIRLPYSIYTPMNVSLSGC